MKAWRCDDTRPIPGLVLSEIEQPRPGPGELVIRVCAAGITPTELSWYPTTHTLAGEPRKDAIPGHEFSGVIAALGDGAEGEIGQAVFGMNDWFAEGASAEYCCASGSNVVPKPEKLTHIEAASVPLGTLTAWQAIFDKAKLQKRERILIHGGSGAVGVYAIQLARMQQASIMTTASSRNKAVLMELGADRVIDYRSERFEEIAGEVDVVLDTIGGSTLGRSWEVLAPGGKLVTVATPSEATVDERTKSAFFIVEPRLQELRQIVDMINEGTIKAVVEREVPFESAGDAYMRPPLDTRGCGKSVLRVS